ncbi:dienelactone hydrolase family protein [Serinibacter salmoneus]|uniref:Carboxymethylenebutenolidase n=1 Tax=Serinibacter salmoneus TaxID=556530 RepID=A0A2A9CZC2_9MICO|nr:dienelactone hydrolase family protein [Serinibacter salmoneus]PFG19787.1 carboxymethylenebutenolidase [Serinibacter salmoneus]
MSSAATRLVTVPTDAGEIPVEVFLPERGEGPGIVLVQEIFGVTGYIRDRACDFAQQGYAVAVPQLYWRLGLVATPEDGDLEQVLSAGMAASTGLGLDAAVRDTTAVLAWARDAAALEGRPMLLGFCFGGGVAFRVAAENPDLVHALVSYYGSSIPAHLDLADRVTMPSLHHFGEADSFIDLATQARVRAAVVHPGVDWYTYPGANHAFDNPNPAFHHAEASALAWERTLAFLALHAGEQPAGVETEERV